MDTPNKQGSFSSSIDHQATGEEKIEKISSQQSPPSHFRALSKNREIFSQRPTSQENYFYPITGSTQMHTETNHEMMPTEPNDEIL